LVTALEVLVPEAYRERATGGKDCLRNKVTALPRQDRDTRDTAKGVNHEEATK